MTTDNTVLSAEELDALLAGTEGVTPGPWDNTAGLVRAIDGDLAIPIFEGRDPWKKHRRTSTVVRQAWHNLDHVSRCDPDTIRKLVTEVKASRSHSRASGVKADADEIERLSRVYAEATGYYVPFHKGLRSESSDQIRKGIAAVLGAQALSQAQGEGGV